MIGSRAHIVSPLAVAGQIKAGIFLFLADPDGQELAHQQDDGDRDNRGPDADNQKATQLRGPACMAQKCQHENTEHAADPVDRKDVQCVVNFEQPFDNMTHFLTNDPGNTTDQHRLQRANRT